MTDRITPKKTVAFLNAAMALDAKAMHELVETRVRCTLALASHNGISPFCYNKSEHAIGLLGILNCLFGAYASGDGKIAALFCDGRLVRFVHLKEGAVISDFIFEGNNE